jgi:predicted RNA polymerase sigma factor
VTDVETVEAAIASAHRREWARVLATTARVARDLDLAEECVQEAYAAAMKTWVSDGIPGNPAAWLTTTAKRRAIVRAVLAVIHLLFTAGHTAPSGASLVRADLVDRAMHLARMLRELMPDDTEVRGLYALLLVTDARRATRIDADGRLVRLKEQDRSLWDRSALADVHDMIVDCLRAGPPGRYVLQAAIASLYAEAPAYDQTDWPQIVALYDRLLEVWPSPVVALNRAVPLAMVSGPEIALAEVEKLERDGRLSGYHYLPAVKADLLSRIGRTGEAADSYRQAFDLAANEAERAFLAEQIADHTHRA